jgi:hypothetical protein
MFWMAKGDHVFVIQSISLKTEQWENYLKWLLSTQTTLLPAHLAVILSAKFAREMDGRDLDDIQEIVVGGIAQTGPGGRWLRQAMRHARKGNWWSVM